MHDPNPNPISTSSPAADLETRWERIRRAIHVRLRVDLNQEWPVLRSLIRHELALGRDVPPYKMPFSPDWFAEANALAAEVTELRAQKGVALGDAVKAANEVVGLRKSVDAATRRAAAAECDANVWREGYMKVADEGVEALREVERLKIALANEKAASRWYSDQREQMLALLHRWERKFTDALAKRADIDPEETQS